MASSLGNADGTRWFRSGFETLLAQGPKHAYDKQEWANSVLAAKGRIMGVRLSGATHQVGRSCHGSRIKFDL